MKKRLFSILLALCMVLCLVPTTAFAESETEEPPVCSCETACTAEAMNADCPICGAEGALPENCAKCAHPADGAAVQPEGEVSDPQPEGEVSDPQPEGEVSDPQPEGKVSDPQPEGKVSDPQPKAALTALSGEGETPAASGAVTDVSTAADLTAAIANPDVNTVRLAANISISSSLTVNRTVTLDLNGYTLTSGDTECDDIFSVNEHGNLTVKDSGTGGKIDGQNKNCGFSINGGILTLKSGTIINCMTDGDGGAVDISDGGKFEMSGGAITNCKASDDSGAVDIGNGCTFIMNSGTISGCRADDDAGAIFIKGNASFVMNGGTIENCSAGFCGGAVKMRSTSRFTMNGGTISGCTAQQGGGVYVDGSSTFTMNDGSIASCTAVNGGNSVFVVKPSASFTMTGGTVDGSITMLYTVGNNTVYMDGLGTAAYPYQISTADQLKLFRDIVNGSNGQTQNCGACAVLTAAIDLNNEPWTPIGNFTEGNQIYYEGTFDGNGHTISGLNVTGNFKYAGLFGAVKDGTIKNLTVAGNVSPSNIQHIVGSIVGYASNAAIENCSNHCSVTGHTADIVGGIAGFNVDDAKIIDCYNVGTICSAEFVEVGGGIVGHNTGTISNCYNVGTVSIPNSTSVGEIVGNNYGTVENCYYLAGTNLNAVGQNNSNGNITKTESKTAANFANGTVLNLLINGRADSEHPWYETCIYLEAAGKTLPVFKWQHQHQLTHVLAKDPTTSEVGNIEYWYCPVCGKYFADANGDHEITQAETVIPKRQSSGGGSGGSSSYPITVPSKTENGTVTVSPKNASAGSTVTITVKPDSGYVLETISVTDKNGNDLKLTDKSNGKYTFTMPTSKVEIKVTFMEDNSVLNFFYDVPNDAYYYEAVKWAAENGITGGVGNSLFAPNQPCTRAQIVTFLWRAAGSPVVNYLMPFTDVDEGAYYAEAVRWAASTGIVTGLTEMTFGTNDVCTRAQAATMIYRYAQAQGKGFTGAWMFLLPFTDVPEWAYESVAWCYMNGVTTGVSETAFAPRNDCTRAQIVTFLWRAFSK